MPNYSWLEHAERSLFERFPEWANGIEAWRSYVEAALSKPSPATFDELRSAVGPILPVLACPRVFVSHRQADLAPALRIAKLANEEGLEFWLDVLDPSLQALQMATGLKASQLALLTAGIIEMALVNSTHVIVVMTPATRGTLWVPYEYGRVKDAPVSFRAGAWTHPALMRKDFPEYLALGVVVRTEAHVRQWFGDELKNWQSAYGSCQGGATTSWDGGQTDPLPT
jgi:hypothetical protein